MTEEIPTPSDQEPTASEEATAEPAAPLNREQRRALARGKKPAPGAKPGMAQGGAERAAGRGAAPAGGSLFPRTGHK